MKLASTNAVMSVSSGGGKQFPFGDQLGIIPLLKMLFVFSFLQLVVVPSAVRQVLA